MKLILNAYDINPEVVTFVVQGMLVGEIEVQFDNNQFNGTIIFGRQESPNLNEVKPHFDENKIKNSDFKETIVFGERDGVDWDWFKVIEKPDKDNEFRNQIIDYDLYHLIKATAIREYYNYFQKNHNKDIVFGDDVLSYRHSITNSYESIEEYGTKKLKKAKFIFKRPDTGKVILEINDKYLEDNFENVFKLNKQSLQIFKNKIVDMAELDFFEANEKIRLLKLKIDIISGEILKLSIEGVRAKSNQENDFSNSREEALNTITKAIRRKNNKIENLNKKIKEIEKEKVRILKRKQNFTIEI